MKKVIMILVAVLIVTGLALSADAVMKKGAMGKQAGRATCGGECGNDGPQMAMFKTLGLDEKQKDAVQAIHFKARKDIIRLGADEQVAEIELKEILSKDPVDLKAAEAAVRKMEGTRSEMKLTHIKAKEEIKSNLTPEQRKKFSAMMGMEAMERGNGMMGRCNMRDKDDMEGMGGMGHGPRGGEMPEMQHKHH